MKIGLYTDSLPDLTFEGALDWISSQGIEAVEIGTGNFSPAPHCRLADVAGGGEAAARFRDAIAARGLTLSALNCNGNLLDPHPRRRQKAQDTFYRTVEAAQHLGLDTVVTMSGCPGDPSGGEYPNWVTCTWQAEFVELSERQWEEVIAPFWREAGRFARERGVNVAIEMHPGQSVYNTRGLLRLRDMAGPNLGANLDPSHLFWQGMDPLVVVRALGRGGVLHVHAKDTRLDPQEMALNGGLDLRPTSEVAARAWAFRTVGYGHDAGWWRDFVSELRRQGYDGVLSIEHEDRLMGSREGIVKSVDFLKPIALQTLAEVWI
ncbi:MAG: sugar phosphate isomerase/epimerase [Anaerolineales bacterium]|nr:sugar phosphate isomerase/epimerase [Anaerolineales bacterium]